MVVAVLTLALGIGMCTAMFSLVNAVLLRPLPFHEPDRLVWMQNNMQGDTLSHWTLRVDNFLDYRAQAESFEDMAAYNAFFELNRYSLTGSGEPQRLRGIQVSQNFLDVLGVQPLLGRSFMDEECLWNGRKAAILSYSFWQQQFAGSENVIGRSVTINNESVAIVGVLPSSANLNVLFSPGTNVELLLPYPLTEETARWGNTIFGIGRLKPGVTFAQAREELDVIDARLHESNPNRNDGYFGIQAAPLNDHIRGAFRPAFALLSGAVLCVLLIACVNLSNLLLTRANSRSQEFSVRIALGASRWHLVRQTMTESLLLALVGCILGIFVATVVTAPLARLQAFSIPLLRTVSVDSTTLIVTVGLTFIAALLCGVLPALQLWRRDASEVIHDTGTRTSSGKSTAWIRRTLVVSEISLACVLLVGAGLLTRSFVKVLQVDLGFQPEQAFSWRIDTTRPFNSASERVQFYERLAEQVSAVPGIESVGLNDSRPLGFTRMWGLRPNGQTEESGQNSLAFVRMVDHRCLQTMRIGLHAGRYFDNRDTEQSQKVIIISETMARKLWPDQNPIGQIPMVNDFECTIVGVVSDVTHGLEEASQPDMYLNIRQWNNQWSALELVVRARREPDLLIPDIRAAIKEFDATLPSNEFTMMDDIIDHAIAPRRLITGILGSFSYFALLLAAIGLYGVIAYSVSQRTQEIGIRVALGAQRSNVLRLIIKEGLRLVGFGIIIGLASAFVISRVLQSQLYGITARDPFTYVITAIILVAVTLLSCYVPARRATKIDPMEALRYE